MSRYRLHENLLAPARPTSELWRLAGGVALIVSGFVMLNLVYLQILQNLPNWQDIRLELYDGTSARALWLMLLNFLPLLLALAAVVRILHSRNLLSFLGAPKGCIRDFRRVVTPLLALFAILAILPGPEPFSPVRNMAFGAWVLLLPLSVPLIFVQVTTEELLFRGYLQSHLAARFNSPFVWMAAPSALFGLLHYDPAAFGDNALWLALWSAFFGLAAADLTARSGNLGPALALHFTNNLSALALVSLDDYWDGLALYVLPFGPEDTGALGALMPLEALVMLCSWLLARIAIRR